MLNVAEVGFTCMLPIATITEASEDPVPIDRDTTRATPALATAATVCVRSGGGAPGLALAQQAVCCTGGDVAVVSSVRLSVV